MRQCRVSTGTPIISQPQRTSRAIRIPNIDGGTVKNLYSVLFFMFLAADSLKFLGRNIILRVMIRAVFVFFALVLALPHTSFAIGKKRPDIQISDAFIQGENGEKVFIPSGAPKAAAEEKEPPKQAASQEDPEQKPGLIEDKGGGKVWRLVKDSPFNYEVPLSELTSFSIENDWGPITVVPTKGNSVRLSGTYGNQKPGKLKWIPKGAGKIRIEVEYTKTKLSKVVMNSVLGIGNIFSDGDVTIVSSGGSVNINIGSGGSGTELTLEVPEEFLNDLKVKSSDGRIELNGFKAESDRHVELETSFGPINVSELSAKSGLLATTNDKQIILNHIEGRVEASTSFGAIKAKNINGGMVLKTNDKSIEVREHKGSLSAETAFGKITVEDNVGDVTAVTNDKSIDISGVKGTIYAKTSFGAIHLTNNVGDIIAETNDKTITAAENEGSISAVTSFGKVDVSGQKKGHVIAETNDKSIQLANPEALSEFAETSFGKIKGMTKPAKTRPPMPIVKMPNSVCKEALGKQWPARTISF